MTAPSPTPADVALSLLPSLPTLLSSLAVAGWPGIVAFLVVVIGGGVVTGLVVQKLNASIDHRDTSNADADAGKTAVNLANQAQENRTEMDDLEKQDPPTPPKS